MGIMEILEIGTQLENGNLENWKFGKLEIWKNGNSEKWKFRKIKIWKNGNLEKWKFGNMVI